MNTPELIGYYGAGLSSLLAAIKIWEIYRNRRQLHTSFSFIGEENKIIVSSIGKDPVFISHYSLYWRKSRWFGKKKFLYFSDPDRGEINKSISIDNPLVLRFAEEDYFSLNHSKFLKLYIELRIPGDTKATKLKVYPRKV